MRSSAKSLKGFSFSSSSLKRRRRTRRTWRGSAVPSKSSRRFRQGRKMRRSSSSEVMKKLESLRNLIPASRNRGLEEAAEPAADRLFQETADYILRLRAQVVVLQRLIQLYGSESDSSHTDGVSGAVL